MRQYSPASGITPVADGAGTTTGYSANVTLAATVDATVASPDTRACAGSCAFSITFPQPGKATLGATDDGALPAASAAYTVSVSPPSALTVAPTSLDFAAISGATAPPAKPVAIGHNGAFPLA